MMVKDKMYAGYHITKPSKAVEAKMKKLRLTFYSYRPEQYSKTELFEKQQKLNGLMSYANTTNDADLMEACYRLAKKYTIEKGYAQHPKTTHGGEYGFYLEQVQNIHDSIPKVIKSIRAKNGDK